MRIPLDAARPLRDADTRQASSDDAGTTTRFGEGRRYLTVAAELARSGRYADAEQLALEVAGSSPTLLPVALDLLARIYAQQGRYLDAETCWQKALSLSPGNPQYRRGLDTILRERGHPLPRRLFRGLLVAALVALALLLGFGFQLLLPLGTP